MYADGQLEFSCQDSQAPKDNLVIVADAHGTLNWMWKFQRRKSKAQSIAEGDLTRDPIEDLSTKAAG